MLVMSIKKFLTEKFVDWQQEQRTRKTLDDFAKFIGISRPLLSQWMNGAKKPGPKTLKRLVDLYGNEVLELLDIDPNKYIVEVNWDYLTTDEQRSFAEQIQKKSHKNDTKRTSEKRTTRTSG